MSITHLSEAATEAKQLDAHMRSLGLLTLLYATFAMLLGIYALHSALPANVIELPLERSARIRNWFPEGWAFFTAPAQRNVRLPFRRTAAGWSSASVGPNARVDNAFGIRRTTRLQDLEMQVLLEQARPADWSPCDGDRASCFEKAPALSVSNTTARPSLCGTVAISLEPPVPWAWSKLPGPTFMPAKVLRLEVRC